ncbi:MAG: hypothetical protein DF168_01218 [Candidatus Moanabacter tarae]|uniref:Uncharacterized protein n=1 Tax=Candidatus Moanibacter tarae TaxID=2200854 RepID=A0A2Z4ACW6_9BACT|nr:MAG: hypothetical protein DF168_01218 [Candidatus Moanabacter tarae]|tara:strand:+ start:10662 stop:10931 length:270 start_codon:yes stop_codon:yes gene_type:complete
MFFLPGIKSNFDKFLGHTSERYFIWINLVKDTGSRITSIMRKISCDEISNAVNETVLRNSLCLEVTDRKGSEIDKFEDIPARNYQTRLE